MYLVSNQAQTAYDLLTTPTMKRGSIYANGIPLVITEGSTNDRTQIYYDNGTGNPDIARGALNLTSAMRGGSGNTTDGYTYCDRVTIYGGCENECCPSTKITILSGRIYEIRAGGGKGNVNGNTVVKASGGRSSYIRGGGGDGVVKGNVDIDVAGNHVVLFDINGGGNPGRVNGNVSIRLSESASVYASLYAGGWSEGVDGDVSISLSDYASVGGGYGKGIYASTRNGDVRKTIKGDVSVEMTDYAYVYGLHGTDIIGSPIVEGDFTVTMQDSATAESIVAVPSNGVIRGDIRINLNQTAAYAIVNKLKGGKGISGLSTGISLGNGTHDFKINDSAITPGFYDSLLLRKKAVIRMLDNSYATRYTDGTQQLTLEEYKAGNRVLDIAVAPTTITPSAVEMFQIVQPSGTPGGTWYIDSTQTADMGLLKKATIAASTPVIGTASGLYPLPINVTLSCSTSGATLRYTLDGSEPTSTSAKYSSAVTVTNSCTLKVKAFKNGMLDSATESAIYTDAPVIDTPTFTPAAGTYITPQNVAISCTVSGVTIRYTTDGNDPTASSTVYTTPISVAASTTIKAKAYKTGMTESAMATAGYTISYISATVAPATASFDRYDGAASGHDDLTFTLTPGSYTLSAIKIGGSTLTLNSDYTANGNAYTIKKETLATLAAGTGHVITFDMSGGVDPTVALTVTDSAPAPIDPPASDNSIVGVSAGEIYTQGETVKFRAIGGNVSSAHPRVGDKRWLPTDWATNPHGTFNGAPYAASFSTESMTLGAHKLTVTFVKQTYNGSAWVDVAPLTRDQKSVSFVVKASAQPPQTGDRATPVGWAGLALLAIGGIVALASYRRKKRA